MKKTYPYLSDTDFLKEIDCQPIQEVFVKIISLDWQENPIEELQGIATGGNLSINGNSAVRRSGSLNISIPEQSDYFINNSSVKNLIKEDKKIDLEIGYTNTSGQYVDYPILWFPLGLFVITKASFSHSLSGLTISINFQDKMCLLNGTFGGIIPANTTFDSLDNLDEEGNYYQEKVPLTQIIQESMNHYGNEPLENIVISDIPAQTRQRVGTNQGVLLYQSTQAREWFESKEGEPYSQQRTSNTPWGELYEVAWTSSDGETHWYTHPSIAYLQEQGIMPKDLDSNLSAALFSDRAVGYIYSSTIYGKDLTVQGGGNEAEVLEKIKNYLSNFEYYYKNDKFQFQEKRNYLNTSYSTLTSEEWSALAGIDVSSAGQGRSVLPDAYPPDIKNLSRNDYLDSLSDQGSVYNFDNNSIVSSFSCQPKYDMIKNDFIVWGKKETSTGVTIDIRYHLAYDTRPQAGNSYQVIFWESIESIDEGEAEITTTVKMPQYYPTVASFPNTGIEGSLYCATEENNKIQKWDTTISPAKQIEAVGATLETITTNDYRTELFLSGMQAEIQGLTTNDYYKELKNEWTKIQDIKEGKFYDDFLAYPYSGNQQLEIIDVDEFNISKIGRRTKFLNDKDINCLFEEHPARYAFIEDKQTDSDEDQRELNQLKQQIEREGYYWVILPSEVYNFLQPLNRNLNSAFFAIRDLISQYSGQNETISIQCLPIYYLEPNARITVNDDASNIHGDYLISSISLPLNNDGLMTINATKIITKL